MTVPDSISYTRTQKHNQHNRKQFKATPTMNSKNSNVFDETSCSSSSSSSEDEDDRISQLSLDSSQSQHPPKAPLGKRPVIAPTNNNKVILRYQPYGSVSNNNNNNTTTTTKKRRRSSVPHKYHPDSIVTSSTSEKRFFAVIQGDSPGLYKGHQAAKEALGAEGRIVHVKSFRYRNEAIEYLANYNIDINAEDVDHTPAPRKQLVSSEQRELFTVRVNPTILHKFKSAILSKFDNAVPINLAVETALQQWTDKVNTQEGLTNFLTTVLDHQDLAATKRKKLTLLSHHQAAASTSTTPTTLHSEGE